MSARSRRRRFEPEVRTAQDEATVAVVARDLNPCKCGTGRRCPVHPGEPAGRPIDEEDCLADGPEDRE